MKAKKVLFEITKTALIGGIAAGATKYVLSHKLKKDNPGERYISYYKLAFKWIENKNSGKSISNYFFENNLKKIAIYGMGTLGELFYSDIKNSNINISYIIDKAGFVKNNYDIPVTDMEGICDQEEVDVVVVTPVYDFESIEEQLLDAGCEAKIVSLEEVIF